MNTQGLTGRGRSPHSRKLTWLTGALSLGLLAAACSGSGSDSDADAAGEMAVVSEAPAADAALEEVNWGTVASPTSLDPIQAGSYVSTIVTNLCESLYSFDSDGIAQPALAESVDDSDPQAFVYTIRSGVEFWNGDEVTAEDVAYSLNRNLDPDAASNFSTYFENVESIEVTGDREVTIAMSSPDYLLPNQLATFAGSVVQQEYAEEQGDQHGTQDGGLMCTGPYELDEWTPESVVLTANPNYWNSDAQPKASTVNFRLIADEETITSGLLAGDLDGAAIYGTTGTTRLQDGTAGDLLFGASSLSTQLITTKREGPLKDAQAREALSLALPRTGIAEVAYAGTAVPSKGLISAIQPWAYSASFFEGFFDDLEPLSTDGDVDGARELIESAGLEGAEITIAMSSQYREVSDLIVETANSIGLDATSEVLNATESVELYYDEDLRDRYDAFILPWDTAVPDPLEMLIYFKPGNAYNYSGYDNPEYTQLVDEALATADADARSELIGQAIDLLGEDLPWIPIVDQPYLVYVSESIGGAPVSKFSQSWAPWAAHLAGR